MKKSSNGIDVEMTAEEVAAFELEQAQQVAEIEVIQYKIDRMYAYPSIQEQLDMQYWDSVNGTTTWADAIAKVKADYPKGGE